MIKSQTTSVRAHFRPALTVLAALVSGVALTASAATTTTSTVLSFGSVSTPTTLPLTYVPIASGTLAAPTVYTDGYANPAGDYAVSAFGTCTTTVTAGTPCTVNITFTPAFSGLRKGAVQITDPSGKVITVYLKGTGSGAQIAFSPAVQSTLTTTGVTLKSARGVATDGAGNVYIADATAANVVKVTPAGVATVLSTGLSTASPFLQPFGIAVDGAGNVFVSDFRGPSVVEIPVGGGAPVKLPITGLNHPGGLAIDGSGNLFIANIAANNILEYSTISGTQQTISTGTLTLSNPSGVSVDAAGDLFIADYGNGRIVEVPATGAAKVVYNAAAATVQLTDVAVDAAGDLFITDLTNNQLVEVPAGGAASRAVTGLASPYGLTVTPAGNIYIANATVGKGVTEVSHAPTTITFPSTAQNAVSPVQAVTVANIGNAPLTLAGGSLSANFTQEAGSTCTGAPVAPGGTCTVAVSFTPTAAGSLTGSLTLNTTAGTSAVAGLAGVSTSNANVISFPAIVGNVVYGEFGTPPASASSGLPVSFASNSLTVCTVTTATGSTVPNVVTAVGVGTCSLTATQAGNPPTVPAATPVTVTFPVLQAAQKIVFPTIPTLAAGLTGPVPVSASSGLPVTVTSSTPTVCTVGANLTGTLVAAGPCTLTATQAGNADYSAATPVTQSFTVTAAAAAVQGKQGKF